VVGVLFIYLVFSIVFTGQDWMKKLYYTVMPLSFLLMVVGYERQNSFIRLGRNALVVCVVYNFLKLINVIDYDFEGMKLHIPTVVICSILFQITYDIKNGTFHIK
jgi:hypothetical protein